MEYDNFTREDLEKECKALRKQLEEERDNNVIWREEQLERLREEHSPKLYAVRAFGELIILSAFLVGFVAFLMIGGS